MVIAKKLTSRYAGIPAMAIVVCLRNYWKLKIYTIELLGFNQEVFVYKLACYFYSLLYIEIYMALLFLHFWQ